MSKETEPHDCVEDEMGYCVVCGDDIGSELHDYDEGGEDTPIEEE